MWSPIRHQAGTALNSQPPALSATSASDFAIQAKPTIAYRVFRLAFTPLLHSVLRMKVRGRASLPEGNFVAVANHTQWIDGLVLMAALPASPRLHMIGDPGGLKALRLPLPLVRRIPVGKMVYWALTKVGGLIPIDRREKDQTVVKARSSECMQVGGVLGLFPEAEYIGKELPEDILPRVPTNEIFPHGEGLLPLKKGFAHFALDADRSVVPIAINGVRNLWLGKRIEVVIGQPIQPWTAASGAAKARRKTPEEIVAETQTQLLDIMTPSPPRPRFTPFGKVMGLEGVRGASLRKRLVRAQREAASVAVSEQVQEAPSNVAERGGVDGAAVTAHLRGATAPQPTAPESSPLAAPLLPTRQRPSPTIEG